MRILLPLLILCSSVAKSADLVAQSENERLKPSALQYLGAFRVPHDTGGDANNGRTFSHGGGAAAVRPSANTIWMTGHTYQKLHAELTIPEPVNSENMADLPTAEIAQPFGDLTGGLLAQLKETERHDMGLGGLTFLGQGDDERALYGFLSYYDANHEARSSHGLSWPSTSAPQPAGPFRLGPLNPGYYGGYMIHVSPEWQAKGFKPLICGASQLAIITRTSTGPAAHGFDPADFGSVDPVQAETYLNYPERDGTRFVEPNYMLGARIGGGAFVDSGLVFIGTRVQGAVWYGGGTSPSGKKDPCSGSQGVHSEGRYAVAYGYDPDDLLRVKRGELRPYQVQPVWERVLDDHPKLRDPCVQVSATFDPTRKRLYVVQSQADRAGNYWWGPLVHVYEVR